MSVNRNWILSVIQCGAYSLPERRKQCDDCADGNIRKKIRSIIDEGSYEVRAEHLAEGNAGYGVGTDHNVFTEYEHAGCEVADKACDTADKYGENEVVFTANESAEANGHECDRVVEQELKPVYDVTTLEVLEEAVDKTCQKTPFKAVTVRIDHQRKHACKRDRTAEGHGEELNVAEHEGNRDAERAVDEYERCAFLFLLSGRRLGFMMLAAQHEINYQRCRKYDSRDEHDPLGRFESLELLKKHKLNAVKIHIFLSENQMPPQTVRRHEAQFPYRFPTQVLPQQVQRFYLSMLARRQHTHPADVFDFQKALYHRSAEKSI